MMVKLLLQQQQTLNLKTASEPAKPAVTDPEHEDNNSDQGSKAEKPKPVTEHEILDLSKVKKEPIEKAETPKELEKKKQKKTDGPDKKKGTPVKGEEIQAVHWVKHEDEKNPFKQEVGTSSVAMQ